ncbi:MAG: formylglycine-generating enzyme family protein [Mastigocoleus sp. MO_167.B18]|nr:formylglycine-generating enzyme family protein [Mastigocoleus sp. MO_167.B18]
MIIIKFTVTKCNLISIEKVYQIIVYDMHGNIREWCQDTWQDNYKNVPNDGSPWIEDNNNTHRVLRGGSWSNLPAYCRSAFRYYDDPNYGYEDFGMRVVCSISLSNNLPKK